MAWWALSEDGVVAWWRAPVKRIAWLRRELGATMGWNYLMVTLSGLMAQLPLMWLGRVRGPEEAGFFRLATTIVTTVGYVEGALGRVVSPILATRMHGEGPRRRIQPHASLDHQARASPDDEHRRRPGLASPRRARSIRATLHGCSPDHSACAGRHPRVGLALLGESLLLRGGPGPGHGTHLRLGRARGAGRSLGSGHVFRELRAWRPWSRPSVRVSRWSCWR